jgi:hypothetical protein
MRKQLHIAFIVGLSLIGLVPLLSLTNHLGWYRWAGWINDIVNFYRGLTYPIYDYLATLVDYQFPGWGKDYINSSGTFYVAYSKAMKKYYGRHWFHVWRERLEGDESDQWAKAVLLFPMIWLIFILFLPVAYICCIFIGPADVKYHDYTTRDRWLVRLYLLGFLALEFINLQIAALFRSS